MKLMGSAYSWSETGYVAEHHIEEAISKFSVIMREHWGHTKYSVVLLADNLWQHQFLNTLELSAKNKIMLQMVTPNASHYLQLLDDRLFAIFKDPLEIWYWHLLAAASSLGLAFKDPLVSVIPDTFFTAFTPLHVWLAWCNVGIWPYQHHLILERALKCTHKISEQK